MKKTVVDYRQFRLSKWKDPQYVHLLLLLAWVGYFAMYFITENFIPTERCYVVHSPLDDLIPFCEVFVIPYVFWYLFVAGSLLYFLLYNVDSFKKLMIFIIVTQVVAMAIYIIFPNRQDLRPEMFPRDNFFTDAVRFLYTVDTDTNVCPSLHVGYSIAIASVWVKEKGVSRWIKAIVVALAVIICAATTLIKQHSVIDTFVAIPMCLLAEGIVYGSYWKNKFRRKVKA